MQPLLGKILLPWYGGLPSVWNACLVFFQTALLLGYAYAHFLQTKIPSHKRPLTHAILLVLSLLLLPLTPEGHWGVERANPSELDIFLLLATRIGAPFALLASTGPLMQSWLVEIRPGYQPYRLFALSNAGSLAALLLYPFALEPYATRGTQASIWSIGYGAFVALALGCSWIAWRQAALPSAKKAAPPATTPRPASRWLWVALAAGPSLLLLAVTNHLCQELPSFPFLWVLPLGLYLLSFILCFDREGFYRRPAFLIVVILALVAASYLLRWSTNTPAWLTIAGWSFALWACSMVCHGELSLRKPDPRFLSSFYLAIALGGALGGLFGGLVAPRIFSGYFELPLSLFLCPMVLLASYWTDPSCDLAKGKPWTIWVFLGAGLVMLGVDLSGRVSDFFQNTVYQSRDFFGVIRIYELNSEQPKERYWIVAHGSINHGYQCLEPQEKRAIPMGYYGKYSGVDEAFRIATQAGRTLRVGVVGLGAGTVAAYGKPGDILRFYEISPAMAAIASERFFYLRDSKAKCEIVLGDARLSMEKEEPQEYDILVLDAFNSDSIPAHLLTQEAFAVYAKHLKRDGILAIHISNKFLDLEPLTRELGKRAGLAAVFLDCPQDLQIGTMNSEWGLLSFTPSRIASLKDKESGRGKPEKALRGEPWTDDFGSLFQVLR